MQRLPEALRQALRAGHQIGHRIDPKDKPHAGSIIPAVQMLRLAEVRVAPQQHLPKTGGPTQVHRPIIVLGGRLTARAVAAPIDQIQRLARVGQGKQQRMIAPEALVRDIHPLLALARRLGNRAVGLQDGLPKEGLGLLLPDLLPNAIDDLHQMKHLGFAKASTKVSGGRGIGNPLGPQGIQIHLIIS